MTTVIGYLHDDSELDEHIADISSDPEIPEHQRKDLAMALSNILYEVGVILEWDGAVLSPNRVIISGVTYKLANLS